MLRPVGSESSAPAVLRGRPCVVARQGVFGRGWARYLPRSPTSASCSWASDTGSRRRCTTATVRASSGCASASRPTRLAPAPATAATCAASAPRSAARRRPVCSRRAFGAPIRSSSGRRTGPVHCAFQIVLTSERSPDRFSCCKRARVLEPRFMQHARNRRRAGLAGVPRTACARWENCAAARRGRPRAHASATRPRARRAPSRPAARRGRRARESTTEPPAPRPARARRPPSARGRPPMAAAGWISDDDDAPAARRTSRPARLPAARRDRRGDERLGG